MVVFVVRWQHAGRVVLVRRFGATLDYERLRIRHIPAVMRSVKVLTQSQARQQAAMLPTCW